MNFFNPALSLILAASIAFSSTARAEGALPIQQGEPSPAAGILLTPDQAAFIMAEKLAVPRLLNAAVEKAQKDAAAECKLKLLDSDIASRQNAAALSAQVKSATDANVALEKQLEAARQSSKWNSFYVGASAVGGIIVGFLAASFVARTSN